MSQCTGQTSGELRGTQRALDVICRIDAKDVFDLPTNDELADAYSTLEHQAREQKRKRAYEAMTQNCNTDDLFSWPPTIVELDSASVLTPKTKPKRSRCAVRSAQVNRVSCEVQPATGWLAKLPK